MNIEVNDLLVVEDESGNIYQDCVCEVHKDSDCIIGYRFSVFCNNNKFNEIYESLKYKEKHTFKLKEIWHRADEDTYKKVWSK